MKKTSFWLQVPFWAISVLAFALFFALVSGTLQAAPLEELPLWPGLAPGETTAAPDQANPKNPHHLTQVTVPTVTVYLPDSSKRLSDACVLIFPGGGYLALMADYEGSEIAEFWNSKGVAAAVVKYRVPRRPNVAKHSAAWQDAQRAVRLIRSRAEKYGINPEKIGCTGFSAGGHLSLLCATTSQTPAYEPVDALDQIPCHVNFAIPVYPAYVLEDGKDGANSGGGNDSPMVSDFAFDSKTAPLCLIHGDADRISPMGSIAVYRKLRTMGIPAEVHVYALKVHGLLNVTPGQDHADSWKDRAFAWFQIMEKDFR